MKPVFKIIVNRRDVSMASGRVASKIFDRDVVQPMTSYHLIEVVAKSKIVSNAK